MSETPQERVIMVAAASRGLGFAVAQALARQGARLSICAHHPERLEKAAEALRAETGAEVLPVVTDLRRGEDIDRWIAHTVDTFGTIDGLFSNTGGPPAGTFEDFSDDAPWEEAFQLLLMSAVRMARGVLPHMKARGRGVMVFSTSATVKTPLPELTLSTVLRAGVAALAKSLSVELAPYGIRVNHVVPGRIATDRVRELDELAARKQGVPVETVRQALLRQIPMARYGDPEEFGQAVAFLFSDAASYITGATLQVDGGMIRCLF